MLNIKNELKNIAINIKSLKSENKLKQKNKESFSTYELINLQEKYRYLNLAYRLSNKTNTFALLYISKEEILDKIINLKIERKYRENNIEQYKHGYGVLKNKEIVTTIQFDLLREYLKDIHSRINKNKREIK